MTVYSAVRTTGIYCRPGCGARPRAENVTTFELAAAAEAAGYRACLQCRPYRVAGPVRADAPELVCRAVQLIIGGALDDQTEAALGQRLGVSPRHLRRLFNDHLGVTPTQLAHSRRAHFARRLLDDSDLPIAQVAFASGFGSIRHFNRSMRDVFRSSPRDLRDRRRRHDRLVTDGGLMLRMPVDQPFHWDATLRLLAHRAIPGVESVDGGTYRRTIVLDGEPGMLELQQGAADHLLLRAHLPYWEGLIHVVEHAARMLGIDTDIRAGELQLVVDPTLGPIVDRQRGLRIAGMWGPFEGSVQAIVNQTLDVSATRAAMGAIARAHGSNVPGLPVGLTHAFPSADTLAAANLDGLRLARRVTSPISAFAAAVSSGSITLDGTATLDDLVGSLLSVAGVRRSTAHTIAMRLGHHDAFPHDDRAMVDMAERWRPWRALAATHLAAAGP